MPTTKGLIFDLDGTLTLTQQFHAMAFSEVFKNHGVTYSAADDYRYAGKGSHCIFPEFFKEHGITLNEKQVEDFSNEKKVIYDRILAEHQIEKVAGIDEFLTNMKNKGIRMIVASGNKLEAVQNILKRTNLWDFFDEIITNKDVKKSKPDPEIFLKAAEKLKLKPEECIVFEDAINGINAAKAGGMTCIALTTGNTATVLLTAGAAYAVKNYTEITDTMLKL